MNNVFVEEIIKREWKSNEYLKMVALLIGGGLLLLVLFYILSLFSMLIFLLPALAAGVTWGCWLLITGLRIEYEYSVTDGYLVIDQIISRRKRKRLIAFEIRDAEAFGKFTGVREGRVYDSTFMAHDNVDENERWYFELTHKDAGRALVVFTPSERMLTAIKPFLRRQIAIQAFGR